jgi:hypothetical protein
MIWQRKHGLLLRDLDIPADWGASKCMGQITQCPTAVARSDMEATGEATTLLQAEVGHSLTWFWWGSLASMWRRDRQRQNRAEASRFWGGDCSSPGGMLVAVPCDGSWMLEANRCCLRFNVCYWTVCVLERKGTGTSDLKTQPGHKTTWSLSLFSGGV